jgi:hypothetical protein
LGSIFYLFSVNKNQTIIVSIAISGKLGDKMNILQIKRFIYTFMKYLKIFEAISRAIRIKSFSPIISFLSRSSWRR